MIDQNLKQVATEALELLRKYESDENIQQYAGIQDVIGKLSRILEKKNCWCLTCRPITFDDVRFVVCPDCGNKRCPKANNHENECTNSNEVGQPGSSWEHVKPQPPIRRIYKKKKQI